jgi:RNA polymerase sigma factor (sigma-70 family)
LDTITDIIEGCKRRDINAQKKLYLGYFSVVKHTIRYYVKDTDVINDLTQECFLKIFDKINTYSGTGAFEGWVKRMASNMALDYFRKNSKYEDHSDIDVLADSYHETEEEDSVISQIGDVTNLEMLQQAIDQLPFRIRMVFVLHVIEHKSHEDIAKELNITVPNSRKRLQTARTWLKEYLISQYKDKIQTPVWK